MKKKNSKTVAMDTSKELDTLNLLKECITGYIDKCFPRIDPNDAVLTSFDRDILTCPDRMKELEEEYLHPFKRKQ